MEKQSMYQIEFSFRTRNSSKIHQYINLLIKEWNYPFRSVESSKPSHFLKVSSGPIVLCLTVDIKFQHEHCGDKQTMASVQVSSHHVQSRGQTCVSPVCWCWPLSASQLGCSSLTGHTGLLPVPCLLT